MDLSSMSDGAALAELGDRLRRERLNRNMTQSDLAGKSGVARATLQNLESGRTSTMVSLVRVLRALGKLDALDAFLPVPSLSPLQLAKLKGRERQRARSRRGENGTEAK
jgi:putative transcriptional regulator